MNRNLKTDNTVITNGFIRDNVFYPKRNLPSSTLRIVLTTACNYKCIYCFAEGEPDKRIRMLDLSELEKVLNVAKEFGITNIKLTGGEPLCYPYMNELLGMLKHMFPYVDMTTNASLLDREKIELLNQHHVSALTISLNSLKESRYEYLTNEKKFKVVIENIKMAIEKFKGSIRINSVVFDDVDDLQDYYDIIEFCYAKKIGLRIIEPTKVEQMDITKGKKRFHELLDILKEEATKKIMSDCESVEYLFFGDWYITVMHSLCDNTLCNACVKYMYLRITSDMKLKPCLSRRDTEVAIDISSESSIRRAFIESINNMGVGVSATNT